MPMLLVCLAPAGASCLVKVSSPSGVSSPCGVISSPCSFASSSFGVSSGLVKNCGFMRLLRELESGRFLRGAS